ncbi:hypothetical protein JHK85_045509 [Glycine max]|nr:hypothetical protein JHK85_045509 [Glycine max]
MTGTFQKSLRTLWEEFHLLSKNSIYEHSPKYKYLHISCVQVAIKPLIDMGIDATVLMCFRDIRHNKFEDSLIGTEETSLGQCSIYFNCYQNKTMSLMDRNILDSLFLNIHFHGLDMKEGSILAALIYRIQYKVMNTCASRVLLKPQRGETTLFITDMTKKDIDYPWKQDIIGDPTTNVITNWQTKDGELIQSELPPTTQYQLPRIKDNNDKHVMASPFKAKDVNEEVTSKDIKSLMEQENYTNKYLQVLGESIKTKVVPKHKSVEEASSSIPIEKPLFKPSKISDKAKRKIRELRKNKSLIEGVGDNNSELLNKLDSLLKVIPETPQTFENTSKMVTRSTSKLINVINEDSDQNSENTTEVGSVSEKDINPINSRHWKTPSKLYYQRPTTLDLLLEERDRSAKLLSNLKCRTLADFRWYRDTFLTRVYTREDSQQPFWKENFLASLPRSLGDKVRDKIHSQSANGDIPYESLSYALKICQDDKIQRQLAKEKAQTKRDLGSFCEQFGLPACPKQKKKQTSRKEIHENKPVHKKRFTRRRYSHKPSTRNKINQINFLKEEVSFSNNQIQLEKPQIKEKIQLL